MELPTTLRDAGRPAASDRAGVTQDGRRTADHDASARLLVLIARARIHRVRYEQALAAGDAVTAALHLGRWQGTADVLRLEADRATEGGHG